MTLKELAQELQDDLATGVLNFIVYKKGRSWELTSYNSFEHDIDLDEELKYMDIKSDIDKNAIIINGFDSFAIYTLKYIQFQIKKLYYN